MEVDQPPEVSKRDPLKKKSPWLVNSHEIRTAVKVNVGYDVGVLFSVDLSGVNQVFELIENTLQTFRQITAVFGF